MNLATKWAPVIEKLSIKNKEGFAQILENQFWHPEWKEDIAGFARFVVPVAARIYEMLEKRDITIEPVALVVHENQALAVFVGEEDPVLSWAPVLSCYSDGLDDKIFKRVDVGPIMSSEIDYLKEGKDEGILIEFIAEKFIAVVNNLLSKDGKFHPLFLFEICDITEHFIQDKKFVACCLR